MSVARLLPNVSYQRERFETADGDFFDVDWVNQKRKKAVILCHGLEGSSSSRYMIGMSHTFSERGWDVGAMNFRGCSGEINRLLSSYHSGQTEDVHQLVQALINRGYEQIALIGFSLGGNVSLKYIGERGAGLFKQIVACVTFSVPCDLQDSAYALARLRNRPYMDWFLRLLKKKLILKSKRFPGLVDLRHYEKLKTFEDFDSAFTAPFHGFASAYDYWKRSSSKQFIDNITIPTLLVNACDDTFLGSGCFPIEEAKRSKYFFLEYPKFGGHAAFSEKLFSKMSWAERRAIEFIEALS